MTWLLSTALSNALLAGVIAAVALVLSRGLRCPALAHVLWILVLVKLITPPLLPVQSPISLGSAFSQPTGEPVPSAATESLQAAWTATSVTAPGTPTTTKQTTIASVVSGERLSGAAKQASPKRQVIQVSTDSTNRSALAPAQEARRGTEPAIHPGTMPSKFNLAAAIRWLNAPWLLHGAALAWLSGSVVVLLIVAWCLIRFSRMLAQRTPAPAEQRAELLTLARAMGLTQAPSLELISGPIRVPARCCPRENRREFDLWSRACDLEPSQSPRLTPFRFGPPRSTPCADGFHVSAYFALLSSKA